MTTDPTPASDSQPIAVGSRVVHVHGDGTIGTVEGFKDDYVCVCWDEATYAHPHRLEQWHESVLRLATTRIFATHHTGVHSHLVGVNCDVCNPPARDTEHVSDVNPYPSQLDDDRLLAQFSALRAVATPTLVELIDLRSTVDEMIRRDAIIASKPSGGQDVSSDRDATIGDFYTGQRVQLHPATGLWMRGARYGTVESVGRTLVHVHIDRLDKTLTFPPRDLLSL